MYIDTEYRIDIAQEIISSRLMQAIKDAAACTDARTRLRLEERVRLLKWELDSLTGANDMLAISLIDKAFNQYAHRGKEG